MSDQVNNRGANGGVENPDFALLSGSDEYTRYFNLLAKAYGMLQQVYKLEQSHESHEAAIVYGFLTRLLYTTEALRMKYMHMPTYQRMMWVDLSDSGFPNAQDISMISIDLLQKETRLRELPSDAMLKQILLDQLFEKHEDSPDLLWQLAERSYLEMLEESKVYLPFSLSPADVKQQPNPSGQVRTYLASWGCYDFKTNRPYLHLMTFDQDPEFEPLQENGAGLLKLLEVIQGEGSRVPDVGILAMAIDDALEPIHPKIVKRICLGPLYAPFILDQEGIDYDEKHQAMAATLKRYASPDDFILFLTHEIVFSKRQQISRSLFAPGGRVREVFHLPDTDPEVYKRRASVVHQHVLLPHAVAQHLDEGILEQVPEMKDAKILTYDTRGIVYGRE